MQNKKILERIEEARDVSLYKTLLDIFSDYCGKFPATGVDTMLSNMIDRGKSIIPSDKNACAILSYVLKNTNESEVVQKILNLRFANLPVPIKPTFKNGRKIEVAFWSCKDVVGDKVLSLLNFDGGKGRWTNEKAETVEIIGD